MSQELDHHGHSPAAWTAVIIMLLAFTAGAVFFWMDMPTYVMWSAVALAAGPIVGWLVAKLGWGVNGPHYKPKHHS